MTGALAIAFKDLRLLWRDKGGMFWILLFPLMFAFFFGTIFGGNTSGGGSSGMRIAFVDLDNSDGSRAFIADLSEKSAVNALPAPDGGAWTLETAREGVLKGDAVAYVAIPQGFGGTGGIAMFMEDPPELEVGVDPSRQAEKGFLEGLLMEASFMRLQDAFANPVSMKPDLQKLKEGIASDPDISPQWKLTLGTLFTSLDAFADMADEAIEQEQAIGDEAGGEFAFTPIEIKHTDVTRRREGPLSAFEISFPQAIVWGIMGAAAGLAMMLVKEKTQGTWVRLLLGPHTKAHILAGKGLACWFTCMFTITVLMLVGHFVLGVRVHSWVNLALSIVCSGACFTGLMMIFSTLGKTEESVAGWSWGGMMPMAMIGGGMVPLMMMPSWMQKLSNISPVKWSVYSMEGAIWRGFSTQQMLLPCGILFAIGLVGYAFGTVVLSRREG